MFGTSGTNYTLVAELYKDPDFKEQTWYISSSEPERYIKTTLYNANGEEIKLLEN
jgi:hypothetical protein